MIELPWPPSVNRYWRSHQGKVLISREGRQYRKRVMEAVVLQRAQGWGRERLAITIKAFPPDRRARDLDNLNKAILDALEHAGIYQNDSQIDDLRIRREALSKPGRVEVSIEPAQEEVGEVLESEGVPMKGWPK